ncbi:MAG: choice-of-anchor L domain-containing protein [Bacteroidales bacterium]
MLTGITSGTTYDACVLEFDFVPESDTLRFRYKFGSDEYNEYVGSIFNDVFGFFVTGPNPDGGMYTNQNVAVLPNTNISVTINNVNNGYANPGIVPTGPCTNCAYFADNTGGLTLEYDAFTTVITATLKVVPCQTYTISIGVADVGDHIFDSGVFIEENSFESPKIEVETDPFPQGVSDNMIEGCVEADIIFRLPHAEYAPITVCFEIVEGPGYATNGVDYEEIEDCITFEDGQDSVAIHVVPLKDGLIEGDELIQLIIENTLGCIVRYDTVEFIIVDYVDMLTQTSGNTMICEGQEIDIGLNTYNGIPPYTFEWDEVASGNDTITVSPDTTTMYHINVIDMCMDTVSDSLNVMVFPTPDIDLGNDSAVICEGDTLFLEPGGGYSSYTWQDGSSEPTYAVTEPGLYFVTVATSVGCSTSDSIYVTLSYMDIYLGADTTICIGDTMVLNAGSGFTSYNWQDGSSGSTYTVTETGLYYVDVTMDGCSDTDSIYIYVDDPAISVDLGNDVIVCQGEEVILEPLFGVFISYLWSTGDTTSKITVTEPGTYSLSVVSGCGDASDQVTVVILIIPIQDWARIYSCAKEKLLHCGQNQWNPTNGRTIQRNHFTM